MNATALPLCPHSPVEEWDHWTMTVLWDTRTNEARGLSGWCRACGRMVEGIRARVPGFDAGVFGERVEHAADNRADGFHADEGASSDVPDETQDDAETSPKGE